MHTWRLAARGSTGSRCLRLDSAGKWLNNFENEVETNDENDDDHEAPF
jgi:hypothetical protein